MALKNDDTIPSLGRRLLDLMEEMNYDSPKDLAKVLYDRELVHVNTRMTYTDEYDIRSSAIGSIEKKIVRHIKTGTIADTTGEFLPAYCKLLFCSSDYILGLTDIRSDDYEIRRITELTGLDEKVIGKFIDYNDEDNEHVASWWSYILNLDLFDEIPDSLEYAGDDLEEQYHTAAVLDALQWQIKHCPKDHSKDSIRLYSDQTDYEDRHNARVSSFQGWLYKISRSFTDAVEKHVIETKQEFKEQEQKEWITHVQNLAKQDIFYYNFRKSESEVVHMPDDIWEQLPQSFPDEGRDLARQLMNDRFKTERDAFKRNHPKYDPKALYQEDEEYQPTEEDLRFQERLKKHLQKQNNKD